MVIDRFSIASFSEDFGDIKLSDVKDSLTFACEVDGKTVLYETYYPDADGKVFIRDIGEVLRSYFVLPVLGYTGTVENILFWNATITGLNQIEKRASLLVYCNIPTNLKVNDYIGFFSRYSRKKTAVGRKEYLSFFENRQVISLSVAYIDNATEKLFYQADYLAGEGNPESRIVDVSLSKILSYIATKGISIGIDDILFYEFTSKYSNDKYSVRYTVDKRHFSQKTNLMYRNCFGMPETITLTGLDEKTLDLGSTFAYVSGSYRKTNTTSVPIHKINTGFLSKEDVDAIEDLISSDVVYLYDENVLEEIVITGIEVSQKIPSNRPDNYLLTYRHANKHSSKFKNKNILPGTFDKTFDRTFD